MAAAAAAKRIYGTPKTTMTEFVAQKKLLLHDFGMYARIDS